MTMILGLQVAERLWVPCPHRSSHDEGFPVYVADCKLCQGTGKVFPLRVPCPELGWKKAAGHGDCSKYCRCQGYGYTAITDYDALLAAVRAKGWFLCLFQYFKWDHWVVQNRNGDPIAETTKDEGLQDTVAILTVIVKALDHESSVR